MDATVGELNEQSDIPGDEVGERPQGQALWHMV